MEKDLIPKDYSRCSNSNCNKKENCKRFVQYELDLKKVSVEKLHIVAAFSAENCERIIKIKG